MDIYGKFKEIGFSENEAKTYVALLKQGESNLKSLESSTCIHRANLLGALSRLEGRGAVGISFSGKRKHYYPSKPEEVLQRVVEKAEQAKQELLGEVAHLRKSSEHSEISVFYGKEAIRGYLDDELERGQPINVIQSTKNVDMMAGQYLWITREKRWRKGMKMRIIYSKVDTAHARKAAGVPKTEAKISNVDMGPVTVSVYGDRVALLFGDEPKVVRITSKDVAHTVLGLFESIWLQSKSVGKAGSVNNFAETPNV